MMKSYPLVFRFNDVVVGKGFLASVVMDGRVLLTDEGDGDFWMFGVQPGGVAGGDRDQDTAFREFKMNYLSVLHDIVAESDTFAGFCEEVKQFFYETNRPNSDDWDAALVKVKKGGLALPNLERVSADLQPPRLKIDLLDNLAAVRPANDRLFGLIKEAA